MVANDARSTLHDPSYAVNSNSVRDVEATIAQVTPSPIPDRPQGQRQDPVAVVGVACRLPGHCSDPHKLWEFIVTGGIATADSPPESRFSIKGHYDGSLKPHTMRSPGGMFLEDIDLHAFDAKFFNINRTDATAMDPQQRQLLEVVYECLENGGITLESISGKQVGCFVGSYAVDYADMQARDPEDRAESITIGIGRAILSNRISHFLNINGPSMTIDTACSGSLVSLDVACQYLQARQADAVIVAGANIYLSPDHNQDMGAMRGASSATGRCHTFDAKADGYIKAEAVNAVFLKRLDDAIRDRDPIRAVIRGTATNSDGWTPGIASPSSEAQAAAIRTAYANAGITDFNETGYLECHGTGTLAGDPVEVSGAASVFSPTRDPANPLIIGSIKSNIGHSEPAAGISGLLKAVLAVENGVIPGNPTFVDPNPKIEFERLRVRATRWTVDWPQSTKNLRRASVNSFGYGGSNAHVVVEAAEHYLRSKRIQPAALHATSYAKASDDDLLGDDGLGPDPSSALAKIRPQILVFSANDEESLKLYLKKLSAHLLNPSVSIKLSDLAYTLSERRSRHFHRAFAVISRGSSDKIASIPSEAAVFGKQAANPPKLGFVFTGQGAQWSQMGRDLLATFPKTAGRVIKYLDDALQSLPDAVRPAWSLLGELTEPRSPEHLRQPEFSQPIVTALQLAMLAVLKSWGIRPRCVVGHSSGEIAAACAAGLLTPEQAIKAAYFRGHAAKLVPSAEAVGMLAVGIGADAVQPYLDKVNVAGSEAQVQVACYNSPSSLTLSGKVEALDAVRKAIQADGHFARMLQVSLAYHSRYMGDIGDCYKRLLDENQSSKTLDVPNQVKMFSSVTGAKMTADASTDIAYWKANMVSPVRFAQACRAMLVDKDGADFLVELGPSNALAGPVGQIKKDLPGGGVGVTYTSAAKRGPDTVLYMFDVVGRLFLAGGSVSLAEVNKNEAVAQTEQPAVIVDLPNYAWNHSTRYWQESDASKDWRFRKYVHHDLLGSKVLGASWHAPTWKKSLRLEDVPWLKDHKMGPDIIFPGAGYIAMAVEAVYQATFATATEDEAKQLAKKSYHYRLRNLMFPRALVLDEATEAKITLSLYPVPGSNKGWFEYKVSSQAGGETWTEHSTGFIRLEKGVYANKEPAAGGGLALPLQYPTPGRLWYKAMHDAGYNFGKHFQKHLEVESTPGQRYSRSLVSLDPPPSKWPTQSSYPLHPACLDGCFQSVAPSLWAGDRSSINAVLVPAAVDSLVIAARPRTSQGLSVTTSEYLGVGRREDMKNYASHGTVYDPADGSVAFELKGLRYHRLETRGDLYSAHTYTRLAWKPDFSLLTDENKLSTALASVPAAAAVEEVIDLAAHKNPNLAVLELNLVPGDTSSLWLAKKASVHSTRAAYRAYHFGSSDPTALLDAEQQHSGLPNSQFGVLDPTRADFAAPADKFDLVIAKVPALSLPGLETLSENLRKSLAEHGSALIVGMQEAQGGAIGDLAAVLSSRGFRNTRSFRHADGVAYLTQAADAAEATSDTTDGDGEIALVRISDGPSTAVSSVVSSLQGLGRKVTEHAAPAATVPSKSTVLILDEIDGPALATATQTQWDTIKQLVRSECNMVWVTQGAQMAVTDPVKAVAQGFFRTVRAEEPLLSLLTLDVESGAPEALARVAEAVDVVLNMAGRPPAVQHNEFEFVERRGILHISRVLPDEGLNVVKFEDLQGRTPRAIDLHESRATVRLVTERLGNVDSLHYAEVGTGEPLPLGRGRVEVELYASALNFKDVAVSMGIVPENEHLLGLEGAGVVVRVGEGVTSRHVGQRVLVFEKGTFANRIIATTERTYPLPDTMTYEEAATLPAVYLTSMYALLYLANLKHGQKVLIHSASGGVGIASIQLCRYKNCEAFVTVGTEEKRQFLMDTFGIPADHIFSSRSAEFARNIMAATNGYGVDVILNSLTGELLNESWSIIADGGTMVEIGKKDILDRNSLPMEPFGRNASFRALDFSYREISDALIAEILAKLFELIEQGHVKPIAPIQIFPYDDIAAAFRVLRGGKHIGKLVVSNGPNAKIQVQVRPAKRQLSKFLRPDVAYLIVGGLKGLCGSLAVYLAKNGAKHLAVMSRSGYDDDKSKGVIKVIRTFGASIDLLVGDVSVLEDVRRCFGQTTVPIGGIIQGAMVLQDRTFASMTHAEYHGALGCKVQGTWNLHQVALERSLPLSFFTMLSSISGVVGQKGQANYAGGNVFLDSLAAYRRDVLGLPACSVDLGVIEDVGYIHDHDGMQQQLDTSIWTGINEGLLRRILEYSIYQQAAEPALQPNPASAGQLITGIPVPQPSDSQLLRDARFRGLHVTSDGGGSGGGAASDGKDKALQTLLLLLRTSGADGAAVLAAAVAVINTQFTKTLRLAEPMDPSRPLSIYGLDSLAAVEFRNWVRMTLGAELTTLEIVNAQSLTALCEKIVAKAPRAA